MPIVKSSAPAAPKRPALTREQALVLQIITSQARGKQHFANAGAKKTELRALCPVGTAVVMPDGRRFVFVDAAGDGKELFSKMTYIERYELKEMQG